MKRLALQEHADALLRAWREARGTNTLPTYQFATPLGLRQWIGNISIVHLHEGEKRFFVSLHGANVARHLGPTFHKKYLEDAVPEASHRDTFAPYELSIKTRQPSYSIQRATLESGLFKCLERMVLPLSMDDPETVGRFLVWVAPIESGSAARTSVYAPFDENEVMMPGQSAPEKTSELFLLSEEYILSERTA